MTQSVKKTHVHLSDIHGYSRLVIEATLGVTSLVEAMHHNILRVPQPFGQQPTTDPSGVHGAVYKVLQGTSAIVYQIVRGITSGIGCGLDAALSHLEPELAHINSSRERAVIVSILNGVLGDHMARRGNPLTITMNFRLGGNVLAISRESLAKNIPDPKGKILLMLHGHCMNELQWRRKGHDHGETLAAANGYTPMYIRYNSGLHISQNGRALADRLEELVSNWQVPVEDISILGYSMGGLVARSALHYGADAQHSWVRHAHKLMFIGTPHHGSMVEQAGNFIDLALEVSPYSVALSRLGKIRSAGTTDLRHGNVIDEDWKGLNRFAHAADMRVPLPLPASVKCYAIAAMIAKEHCDIRGKLFGDGLVPLKSALGHHSDERRELKFDEGHHKVFYGMSHLRLLESTDVCAQLQEWLGDPQQSESIRLNRGNDAQWV